MKSISRKAVAPRSDRQPRSNRAGRIGLRLAVVAAATVALGLPGVGAQAVQKADSAPPSTPLERVQALVQPAVVYEQIEWTAWVYDETNKGYFTDKPFTAAFQCTGFVVNPTGYIGTAGHCVDYDAKVRAKIVDQVVDWAFTNEYYLSKPSKATIATFARNWRIDGKQTQGTPDRSVRVAYGVSVSGEPTGKALAARVVATRAFKDGDAALLKTDAQNLTVASLSDNKDTRVGTQVVSVGYPLSVDLVTDRTFTPSFKEGSISAEKTTEGGLFQVYEISAAVSGGMSGGPTTNLNGDVVGVNSFGVVGETQQFNFVQASKTLAELMRSEGVDNTPGQVTELYRAGVAAYFAGDRGAAIEAFQKTIEIVPNHEFAQSYLRKSQELPQPAKIVGLPLWLAMLVAAIVVVIIGAFVLFLVVLRGRKRNAPVAAVAYPPPPPPGPVATDTSPPPATTEVPPAPPEPAPARDATPAPEPGPSPAPAAPEPGPPPAPEPQSATAPAPAAPEPAPAAAPAAPAAPKLFCPNCGETHSAGAHFCEHCGQRLTQ